MNFIAALNDAGTACLLAESEVAMQRMMGGFGRRMRNATEAREAALKRLFETLRTSGYTIVALEALRDEHGDSPLAYGVLEILKREYGKY